MNVRVKNLNENLSLVQNKCSLSCLACKRTLYLSYTLRTCRNETSSAFRSFFDDSIRFPRTFRQLWIILRDQLELRRIVENYVVGRLERRSWFISAQVWIYIARSLIQVARNIQGRRDVIYRCCEKVNDRLITVKRCVEWQCVDSTMN